MVERHLAKVEVAGSSPVIRSTKNGHEICFSCPFLKKQIWRHSQAVRQRSAKPSSPVRFRVAPPNKGPHPTGWGPLFGRVTHANRPAPSAAGAREPVRIRRSEIEKLAFQAESVRIFANGEIPGGALLDGGFCLGVLRTQIDQHRAPQARGIRFAFAARRSKSSLFRRRACEYSPEAKYRVLLRPQITFLQKD